MYQVLQTAGMTHGKGMQSYLCMMAVRLLEMRRVLKCKGRRENVPRGRLDRRVWAVEVQGKCPAKRSAKMSPVYWGIVSDVDAGRVAGDRRVGGLLTSMYRLTVSLWRPNSLAILRLDTPSSLAFCTASHRASCRNVDLLGEVVTVMGTTSSSTMTEP